MEKITKRNMYEALVNFANCGSLTFTTEEGEYIVSNEELLAFAENEIGLLDKKAEKAKERAATKKAGADELFRPQTGDQTSEKQINNRRGDNAQ